MLQHKTVHDMYYRMYAAWLFFLFFFLDLKTKKRKIKKKHFQIMNVKTATHLLNN